MSAARSARPTRADYRAMNPTGLVPTLQEDDFTLWESNAICRYLCHAHAPHSKLWPQEPHARANVDRWMDAQQTLLNRPIGVVFWGLVRTPPDKRDMAAIRQGVEDAARVWGMVSARAGQASLSCRRRSDAGRHPVGPASASLVQHGFRAPRGAASARLVRPAAAAAGVQAASGRAGGVGAGGVIRSRSGSHFRTCALATAAGVYEATFASATRPFIEALLDAAQVARGTRMLDIACGPGLLASGARARGAVARGSISRRRCLRSPGRATRRCSSTRVTSRRCRMRMRRSMPWSRISVSITCRGRCSHCARRIACCVAAGMSRSASGRSR